MKKSTRSPLDPAPPRVLSMIGQQYGRLTVTAFAGWKRFPCGSWTTEVICSCACGNTFHADGGNVRSGHTTSCGCASSRHKRTQLRHGHTSNRKPTQEYRAWRDMNNRCNRPSTKAYKTYGGRGIRVCDRWMEGRDGAFDRFLMDMGEVPSRQHSLDRADVNGDYSPENCRWATRHEQMRNLRKNRWYTAFGRTQVLTDWAREFGMVSATLGHRLDLGMTLEEAVAQPVRSHRNPKVTAEVAEAIRHEYAAGGISQQAIADRIGVSRCLIQAVLDGTRRHHG